MLGNIEVIEPVDALHRKVWTFVLCEPVIRLHRYEEQERSSTRHKWHTVAKWAMYRGERCKAWIPKEPQASKSIHEQAMATLVGMLRFERWPEKRT